jgi:hypothetical protein
MAGKILVNLATGMEDSERVTPARQLLSTGARPSSSGRRRTLWY